MKVKELIEHLKCHDPDSRVVIGGYEGGAHEVSNTGTLIIALNVNSAWYYGEHEVVGLLSRTGEEYPDHEKVKAVFLS
jgi:hypothetical protein